ncbi:tetratricopeptide repeat protein [Paenibacillus sp. TH7-28]
MPNNVRIALAQICCHAAYTDNTTNFLMEPTGKNIGLSKLSASIPSIKSIRTTFMEEYIRYIRTKIFAVISCCSKKDVDVLILPEYSVPANLIPELLEAAKENGIIIIAGSHMIAGNLKEFYMSAQFEDLINCEQNTIKDQFIRRAVAPVLFPDGRYQLVFKNKASQWETNLIVSDEVNDWFKVNHKDKDFYIGIKICIDALTDSEFPREANGDRLMIIPSFSPKTNYFDNTARFLAANEVPVCYVNEASTGKSKIFGWVHRESSSPYLSNDGTIEIPNGEEAILIADIDLSGQFGKVSTVVAHEPIKVISMIPILHLADSRNEKLHDFFTSTSISIDEITELALENPHFSKVLTYKIKHYLHLVDLGINNKSDDDFLKDILFIEEVLNFWDFEFANLETVYHLAINLVASETMIDEATKVLINVREEMKSIENKTSLSKKIVPKHTETSTEYIHSFKRPYLGRDDAISSFRKFVNNDTVHICGVFGLRGLGKTQFLSDGINSVLPANWKRILIRNTEGTGFNRFILSFAKEIRFTINEEGIISINDTDLTKVVYKMLEKFDKMPPSIILIDDWHYFFIKRSYRDSRFRLFIDCLYKYGFTSNNKIVLTSLFKFDIEELYPIVLYGLNEDSLEGIIDWNIRTYNGDNKSVLVPREIIRQVHGNPLAAQLMAQLITKYPIEQILENTQVKERFQGRLIPLILDQLSLSEDEINLAEYLSSFNLPVDFEVIEIFMGEKTYELISSLIDNFILELNIESNSYQIHPLIKEYFNSTIKFESRIVYHKVAAEYYKTKIELDSTNPVYKGEHISHLASSLQYEAFSELKPIYFDELRPVAKTLFKERKIWDALKLYEILDKLYEETDIKFHIALCYAHEHLWKSAEKYINKAMSLDDKAWWVLQGYADILTKKRQLDPAEKYINQAIELMEKNKAPTAEFADAYQILAQIYEKRKNPKAESIYKKAISLDKESAFIRYAYAKFLYNCGDWEGALSELGIAESLDSSLRQIHVLKAKIAGDQEFADDEDIDQEM